MAALGKQPDIVLVSAPIGADAVNVQNVLLQAGLAPRICESTLDIRDGLQGNNCGALLLTEEALTPDLNTVLDGLFETQPPWSDVPVVLISGASNTGAIAAARLRGPGRTVTLLERPLRSVTLLATLHTVLAARRRQYEIRDLLHERDTLLSSLESRVAERTAELKRIIEEMEAFSYSVSHDLRSPLRSLEGYARALQEDYAADLPPGARVYLDKIGRAARRMDNLTQDVLAYTRLSRCEMEITPVDLDALLADVFEQYPGLDASMSSIRIRAPLGCVRGHVPSLIQCFSNLLGNAFKFVRDGSTAEVEVRTVRKGEWCRVSVKDNGIGIDSADHSRIFGMFERAAGKKVPGTGIGLAIVKKAVERMGGTIGVISSLGRGAEFWIELLAVEPTPDSSPARRSPSLWSGALGAASLAVSAAK